MIAWLKGKVALVVGAGSIGPGWGNGKTTVGRLCAAAFVTRTAASGLMSPSSTAADVSFWHKADVERRCCDAPFVTVGSRPWWRRWWPRWSRRRWFRFGRLSRLKC
jgi:NAD(P)-dependent dehydrogenase (short-subunit alcohol dehydrogenase family)